MPEQDERREHAGGLVEDLALDEERRGDRVQPADADGHRDENHHVQRLVAQRGDRAREEDGRRVEDDGQAEQKLPDVTVDAERRWQLGAEQARADHRPQDDGDREHERDHEAVAHVPLHRLHRHPRVAAVAVPVRVLRAPQRGLVVRHALIRGVALRHRVAHVAGHRLAGAVVAALLDPAGQVGDGRVRGVEGDGCGLRDGVRVDGEYARAAAERMLDHHLL